MRKLTPEQARAVAYVCHLETNESEGWYMETLKEHGLIAKAGDKEFCECGYWRDWKTGPPCAHPDFDGETCPTGRWNE